MKKSIFILILLCGCLRGETKSLDEVFAIAKKEYQAASSKQVPAEVASNLDAVQKDIESALSNSNARDITAAASRISDELSELLPKAGYPVRPALTELRNQYLEMTSRGDSTADEVKLLASRTYSTLAQELTTTKFGVK